MKTLIVYYSYTGNTAKIARQVQKELSCDVTELRTVSAYPDDYETVVDQGQREVKAGFCPALAPLSADPSAYDRIILGTPVWWYTMAPAVRTFLTRHDLRGKIVVPLVTSGGWPGHTEKDMGLLCPGARVEGGISLKYSGKGLTTRSTELEHWIDSLK